MPEIFLLGSDTFVSIGVINMKKISSEEKDDAVLSSSDTFAEEFSEYFKSSPGNYLLNAKARRRIEDLLDDKKLKADFDDFIGF